MLDSVLDWLVRDVDGRVGGMEVSAFFVCGVWVRTAVGLDLVLGLAGALLDAGILGWGSGARGI